MPLSPRQMYSPRTAPMSPGRVPMVPVQPETMAYSPVRTVPVSPSRIPVIPVQPRTVPLSPTRVPTSPRSLTSPVLPVVPASTYRPASPRSTLPGFTYRSSGIPQDLSSGPSMLPSPRFTPSMATLPRIPGTP
jgi:hypothetical protein